MTHDELEPDAFTDRKEIGGSGITQAELSVLLQVEQGAVLVEPLTSVMRRLGAERFILFRRDRTAELTDKGQVALAVAMEATKAAAVDLASQMGQAAAALVRGYNLRWKV